MLELEGYKISCHGINQSLINSCRAVLPDILLNPKYITTGVTFGYLFNNKPARFLGIEPNKIDKNDLFIVLNPCNDYIEIKNLMMSETLWDFAAHCLDQPTNNIAFSFMNITRKPARYGPSINWHRDFGNKMTSTTASINMVRVIVPLDPCEVSNGTVLIVPDSHLRADDLVLEGSAIDINYCNTNHEAVNLVQGDMLGISSQLIHGSGINKSNRDRNNLIFQFIIKGSEHSDEDTNEPFHNIGFDEIRNVSKEGIK
ncbi:MAG: phytanoyl-CoA dioxygenase family protein [Methylococcales bacterium]|nr:phytanoyl-CoA dioxygenase family protein [Methylococcales bacterium]